MNTLERVRSLLLGLLLMASIGTGVELLLLEHYDGFWQFTPLVLLGAGAIVTVWHVFDRGRLSTRVLQTMMILFIGTGALGLFLHYDGNVEFELEMTPALSGVNLFRKAMSGATPALAPGTMIQLGVLGLVCTYRQGEKDA
jgi:hypothetical protein